MTPHYSSDLIRSCYAAYEAKDRSILEAVLSDDFTFSSPLDDNISREQYFERCWPNCHHVRGFHIEKLFVDGDEAFVTYVCHATDGTRFRNTEFFVIEGDKIKHVDVYFGSEDGQEASEAEVRALVEQTAEACRQKNAAELMKHYAPDVMAFDLLNPLRYSGVEPLAQRAQQWFDSFQGPIGYELRDLKVTASTSVAFCSSLNHVSGTKTDGQKIEMWWRATLGLQKLDGRWQVIHAHSSVPFNMETGKAALELEP